MKHPKEFPFERARRITTKEVETHRRAIEAKLNEKRPSRGRPSKLLSEKYKAVAIRLHPKVLEWAKIQAKRKGLGYQTIINRVLLRHAA